MFYMEKGMRLLAAKGDPFLSRIPQHSDWDSMV